jgi:hypothetical protein
VVPVRLVIVLRLIVDIGDASADDGEFNTGTCQAWVNLPQAINSGMVQASRLENRPGLLALGCGDSAPLRRDSYHPRQ